ncbi:MAG: hypothetical protein U9N07_10035 [Euryarchaeota archaeon]|nr:hypothetical protein [Euryarchaeota archaeon]
MIKLTDDVCDKNMAIHRFFAIPCGLIYGLLMGYLMIVDVGASLLFGGIVIGCLITGKINNTGHYFGLFGLLVVNFIYGINLSPLVLLIGALAAMDELNDIIHVPGSLKFVFDYRLILKIGILISVILNILKLNTLIILIVFDLAYISMDYLTSRFSNEI